MPTPTSAFLGMRGTGDWVDNQRPESWRQGILRLYPNGKAPLTAIMSMMASEQLSDPKFHWWTKRLPLQGGDLDGIFTNAGLSTAYVSGGSKDDELFLQAAAEVIKEFKPGHTVLIRKGDNILNDHNAKVLERVINEADSYIRVRLLEDARADFDIGDADRILVNGSMHPEGDTMPVAISYDPVQHTNVSQIFRTSLSVTRTARLTTLRTGDAYEELRREALELHAIEMEKAFLTGQFYEGIGINGKPERSTRGIITAVRESEPENVSDFRTDPNFAGDTWLESGEEWLEDNLERVYRHGNTEKLGLIGGRALVMLQRLIREKGMVELEPLTAAYGIRVLTWHTASGTIHLKTHPLMSQEPTMANTLFILEPSLLRFRYVSDTFFKPDRSESENTNNSKDSTDEEFLTEAGLEYHHTPAFGLLTGIGGTNTVTP